MNALALALVLAAAPAEDAYVMSLGGVPVGVVRLSLAETPSGLALSYRSETHVRRVSVVTHNGAQATLRLAPDKTVEAIEAEVREGAAIVRKVSGATREGVLRITVSRGEALRHVEARRALPSSLAFRALGRSHACLAVVEETTGEAGKLCGTRLGDLAEGTLLDQPFTARLSGDRLERLDLPDQHASFERTDAPPASFDPPDLDAAGAFAFGLRGREEGAGPLEFVLRGAGPQDLPSSANQSATRTPGGARVRWDAAAPAKPDGGWSRAKAIAREVYDAIPDKRPGPDERVPAKVLAEGRGGCVAHTAAFLAAAAKQGVKARRALGLVAADGRLWPHEWVQVEQAGAWYDVDPTEGAAPARAARLLFAAGEAADERAALRLVELVRRAKFRVETVKAGR